MQRVTMHFEQMDKAVYGFTSSSWVNMWVGNRAQASCCYPVCE